MSSKRPRSRRPCMIVMVTVGLLLASILAALLLPPLLHRIKHHLHEQKEQASTTSRP
jgi:hypothetical protein